MLDPRRIMIVFALGACGGSHQESPQAPPISNHEPAPARPAASPVPSSADRAIAKMVGFATAMCACHDAACAQAVADDLTKWGTAEVHANPRDREKFTDDQKQRLGPIVEKMTKCMTIAMSPPASAPGPSAQP
jgi:hypothetical protein